MIVKPQIWSNSACGILPHLVRSTSGHLSGRRKLGERNITDREEIRTPVVSSFVLFDLGITHPNLFQICFFRTSSCPKLRTTDPTN
ncbi:hypothetical protein L596_001094 [Steinernema carpocapsae]|uniref:Uncharacterized protein n=1 Tax=Steinernema carpocapsae TaxID=34508 RepID=A0A4U8UKJ9_STECR|nr:hypothetical protein L596_001094 [Steinernema carpocapsae]